MTINLPTEVGTERRIVVADELPKTAIGKLLRRELRDQVEIPSPPPPAAEPTEQG